MMNLRRLVLVPGLLCTADLYRAQLSAFGDDASVEPIVADTRRADGIADMATRLLDAVDGRFDLCGLSMGGYVALEVVRLAPDRVRSLVLMATSARADTAVQTEQRRRLIDLARERGLEAVADALLPRMLGEAGRKSKALSSRIRRMAVDIGLEDFERQQCAVIERRDQCDALAGIAVPTTIASGTHDQIIDPARSHEMAAAIHGAVHEVGAGLGHMLTMEAPDWATAVLRRHLDRAA